MKSKLIRILLFFSVITLVFSELNAQQSINVTGRDITGSGGTVSYSVGQVVYQTHIGSNGSVAENVQQPFEISIVSSIDKAKEINLSVYPNPTDDYLILEVQGFEHSFLQFEMFDLNGKILRSGKINNSETMFAMDNVLPATYFIKVTQKNKELKTFKIQKK